MKSKIAGILEYSKYFLPLIIIITFFLFFQSFFARFIFLDDDAIIIDGFSRIHGIENVLPSFSMNYLEGHYYRPLTNITFIFNAMVSGKEPWSYHAGNIIIHLLTILLLFSLLKKLGYSKNAVFPAVLLFAISPLQLNAVGWIAGRADLLTGLFSLGAFLLFLKFREREKLYLIPPILFLLLCAFFSKESALLMPLLIFIYFLAERQKEDLSAHSFFFFSLLLLTIVFYYLFRIIAAPGITQEKILLQNLAATILIVPETAAKFIFPFNIKALPDFSPVLSIIGIFTITGSALLPLLLKKINRKKYYFGLIWFLALMLPGLFFRPNLFDKFYYWDCRSYLPSAGLVLMLVEITETYSYKLFTVSKCRIAGIYFTILFICSSYYLSFYADPLTFWGKVDKDYPERYLPHLALYKYYTYVNDPIKAGYNFEKVIEHSPANNGNREKLYDYYIAGNQPEMAFKTALEGLNYSPGNATFIRGMVTSAVLMKKINILDDYLFGKKHPYKIIILLRDILQEKSDEYYNFISKDLVKEIESRIEKLDKTAEEYQDLNGKIK